MEGLAKRAVACRHWRWMPGMRLIADDLRTLRVCSHTSVVVEEAGWYHLTTLDIDHLPDLTDPATLGCLLALVREAWSDPMLLVFPDAFPDRWTVVDLEIGHHRTEVEALVAALEAAP